MILSCPCVKSLMYMTDPAIHKADEQSILHKVKNGDTKAFEKIFRLYYPHLVLFAQQYIGDRDASESLVQDVFVNMWEHRADLEIRSLQGFLVVTVRNRCHNELKHKKVVREFEKAKERKENYELPVFRETVYLERINRVIAQLPEQRQKIFKMSRMEGLKYREIAEKLNISPKTVEAQMGKALKYLREHLKPLKEQLLGLFF